MLIKEAREIAEEYLKQQFPASFVRTYPSALVDRVAQYMVKHDEGVARAHMYC